MSDLRIFSIERDFPAAFALLARLRRHPAFAPDLEPYLSKLGA